MADNKFKRWTSLAIDLLLVYWDGGVAIVAGSSLQSYVSVEGGIDSILEDFQ